MPVLAQPKARFFLRGVFFDPGFDRVCLGAEFRNRVPPLLREIFGEPALIFSRAADDSRPNR
jgi:hypothetical protein